MMFLNKFKNATIVTSTIGLIITLLTLLDVIDGVKADNITKVVGTLILILIQVGILTNPDKSNT
jgi:hypothetical protein